jgi:hypothetical protein
VWSLGVWTPPLEAPLKNLLVDLAQVVPINFSLLGTKNEIKLKKI